MISFAIKLRQYRKARAQTQRELGAALGVPQATISKWERGLQTANSAHAAELARLTGMTFGELLGFGEPDQAGFKVRETAVPGEKKSKNGPLAADRLRRSTAGAKESAPPAEPTTAAADAASKKPYRHPAFGALKGTFTLLPDVDLTEPADPEWGKIYED